MVPDNATPEPSGPGRAPQNDAQDRAEELDDNTLRLDPNGFEDDGLPGLNSVVDHVPMNSEDPSLLLGGSETQDEIHTRVWREVPEATVNDVAPAPADLGVDGLVTPAGADENGRDVESTMIAEATDGHSDATPEPAEVAAVTVDTRIDEESTTA